MCTCIHVLSLFHTPCFATPFPLFRYEEQLKETKLQKEDLSDMVAEHAAKQKVRLL